MSSSSLEKNLYRIVSFERAVQFLKSNKLYFSHPSAWEDPFDRGVDHQNAPFIFALCWCRKAVSDAMWRIYSPHHLGVRIGTTRERLAVAMEAAKKKHGLNVKIKDVKYLYNEELDFELERLEEIREKRPSFSRTVAPIFLKRNAFDHELETRVVVYHGNATEEEAEVGTFLDVEANSLLRSIWIDPRAPKEVVDAYTYYLKEKLRYSGVVKQSSLYTARDPKGV